MIKRILFFTSLLVCQLAFSDILINEVVSDNDNGYQNAFDNYTDWIELYNNGTETINLTGYFLTDDESLTSLWEFPSVSIPSNSFLVIHASGENTTFGGEIHTDFAISKSGAFLGLFNPSSGRADCSTGP